MDKHSIIYDKDSKLSVLFSRDSCRYMVIRENDVIISGVIPFVFNSQDKSYKVQLEEVFTPLIHANIPVSLALLNNKFVLMDSKYINEENKKLLFSTVSTLYPTDQVLEYRMDGDQTSQLYVLPSQVEEIIQSIFPDLMPKHVASTLDVFYKTNILMPGFTMFVCFFESSFLIHLYEEGRLVLTNQYNFKEDSDLLYYVTRLFSLMVKENDSFYIHLSGLEENALDRIVALLSRYYKNAAKISDSLTHSFYSNNRNIDLYSIAICE